ncbi:hypothetical protein J6590_071112 [Homalodisca vitripennis]|nr:hypothetical protein J6590_071112 [Homalodisca vitripennis]
MRDCISDYSDFTSINMARTVEHQWSRRQQSNLRHEPGKRWEPNKWDQLIDVGSHRTVACPTGVNIQDGLQSSQNITNTLRQEFKPSNKLA